MRTIHPQGISPQSLSDFDPLPPAERPGRAVLPYVILSVAVVVFCVILIYAYVLASGEQRVAGGLGDGGGTAAPLVTAEDGPVKVLNDQDAVEGLGNPLLDGNGMIDSATQLPELIASNPEAPVERPTALIDPVQDLAGTGDEPSTALEPDTDNPLGGTTIDPSLALDDGPLQEAPLSGTQGGPAVAAVTTAPVTRVTPTTVPPVETLDSLPPLEDETFDLGPVSVPTIDPTQLAGAVPGASLDATAAPTVVPDAAAAASATTTPSGLPVPPLKPPGRDAATATAAPPAVAPTAVAVPVEELDPLPGSPAALAQADGASAPTVVAAPPPVQPAAVPPDPVAPAQPAAAAPAGGGGGARIQLGASTNRAQAQADLDRLARRHAGLLGSAQPVLQDAVINGTTWYRIQFGGLSRSEAQSLCGALEAAGQDCLVR